MTENNYSALMQDQFAQMFNTTGLSSNQVKSATQLREQGVEEEEVPAATAIKMRIYAAELYKKGVSAKTVKMKVCKKFNVTIIPE